MGRNSLPNWAKKKNVSYKFKAPLIQRIKDEAKKRDKKRSEIVEEILEKVLIMDSGYAKFMIQQKELELSFWKHEYEKAKTKEQMIKDKIFRVQDGKEIY